MSEHRNRDETVTTTPAMQSKHPPTPIMVKNAINNLNERNGSTLCAIKKYVGLQYQVDCSNISPRISRYIIAAIERGELIRIQGKGAASSFKLPKVKPTSIEKSKGEEKSAMAVRKRVEIKAAKTLQMTVAVQEQVGKLRSTDVETTILTKTDGIANTEPMCHEPLLHEADSFRHADWSCPLCTLVNTSDADMCAACSRPRDVNIDLTSMDTHDGHVLGADSNSELAVLNSSVENYLELVKMDNTDLITCLDHFECSVCLIYYAPGDGVILKDCLHTFCRECLAMTIKHNTEAEVKCPFSDDDYVCNSILQEREIKALVSAEVYEEHLARSITEAEHRIQDSFHCKTVNCRGWCILDGNAVEFSCPSCGQINCIKCQTIHAGLTCLQYQETKNGRINDNDSQRLVQNMLVQKQAMLCPGCRVMVMKKDGCDWLRCLYCKTEICWVTRGPRWGPKGAGDTSAGCRCMVKGKKCHPKCGNCH